MSKTELYDIAMCKFQCVKQYFQLAMLLTNLTCQTVAIILNLPGYKVKIVQA